MAEQEVTQAPLQNPVNSVETIKALTLMRLDRMLDYRRQYDQRRSTFYRQYVGQRDAQKFPDNITNRANTFVPYPLSNVETIVARVLDAFFSFSPWFEVNAATPVDDAASDAMSLVLLKKLEQAGLVDAMEAYIRNVTIYGHAGLKVDWNWDFISLIKPVIITDPDTGQPVIDPQTGMPATQMQPTDVPMCCPRISAIDIYDLLCDPDGGIVAHLTERTFIEMDRENKNYYQKTQKWLYDPQAMLRIETSLKQTCPDDWETVIIRFAELWNEFERTCTVITYGKDKEAMGWKDLRASFRNANLSSYKRKIYEGSEVLWHGDNQFDHKRNPILCTSYIKLPNERFGLGAIEIITDLSESLNKFVNMITDNWNLGINRRFAYDVNADIDHEALNQMNVPGGKVPVNGNPNDVITPLPLFTPNAGDYQILELYKGMIETTSGVSDFYAKGAGSPTGNGTATGINSVINESNYRFKMFIRNIEIDILQPLLFMCASMIQQFMTDPEEVLITKNPMGPAIPKWQMIEPADILGNFEFNLVAANYAESKVVRQRNLMAFEQNAAQSPYWKQGEGLRELGKVLEIRNINELLYSDQEVQQMQAAAEQKQMQQALMEQVVQTESKIEVAKAHASLGLGKGSGGGNNKTTRHNPSPKHGGRPDKGGRPSTRQPEGKIPGASVTSAARTEGQMHGANALGLEGLGQIPGA